MKTRQPILAFDWNRLDKLSRDLIRTDTPTVKAVLAYLALRRADAEAARASALRVNPEDGRRDIRYSLGYEEAIQDDSHHLAEFIEASQPQG